MARDGEAFEHCPSLDRVVMAAGSGTLAASAGSVGFGRTSALPSGTIHSRSAAGMRKPVADGGASGVPTAPESPVGRVERGVSRSPAHAAARDYGGVNTPPAIADALNRLRR